jgi:hypothetical protein
MADVPLEIMATFTNGAMKYAVQSLDGRQVMNDSVKGPTAPGRVGYPSKYCRLYKKDGERFGEENTGKYRTKTKLND